MEGAHELRQHVLAIQTAAGHLSNWQLQYEDTCDHLNLRKSGILQLEARHESTDQGHTIMQQEHEELVKVINMIFKPSHSIFIGSLKRKLKKWLLPYD